MKDNNLIEVEMILQRKEKKEEDVNKDMGNVYIETAAQNGRD